MCCFVEGLIGSVGKVNLVFGGICVCTDLMRDDGHIVVERGGLSYLWGVSILLGGSVE